MIWYKIKAVITAIITMPEGPEIRIAADRIAKAIVGQPIKSVFFAFDSLKSYEPELARSRVVEVRPRGKALLTRFENGWTIYSHNQLYGVWYVRKAGTEPTTNRQLRLAIETPKKSALLYSASDILVLNDDDLMIHPFLQKLGPDVLDPTLTATQVEARLLDKKFVRRGFPTLLLNQEFVCGLGNYLRSEVLFLAGIEPWFYRHWVFSRTNQPCYVCGGYDRQGCRGGTPDLLLSDMSGGRVIGPTVRPYRGSGKCGRRDIPARRRFLRG